jgi:DNA polymerase sigma
MPRQYNGRPKGSTTKRCLIKDELLLPYEIHIDESNHSYQVVVAETGNIDGYYTQLPLALKSILKKRCVPNNGETYTLSEYVNKMTILNNDMTKLLSPTYYDVQSPNVPPTYSTKSLDVSTVLPHD